MLPAYCQPNEITLVIDGTPNDQSYELEAILTPIYTSNRNVTWSISDQITNEIKLINLGNNKVRISL